MIDDAGVSRRHAEIRPGPDGLDARRPGLDQRCARQRRRGSRRACAGAGRPRRARLDARSSSKSHEHARARIGGAEVRLPGRPLPVPAVDRAQRPSRPARRAGRFGPSHASAGEAAYGDPAHAHPRSLPPDATGMYSASALGSADIAHRAPRLVIDRAPGHDPGMIYDLDGDIVLGRGDHAEIRLEDPFASSRHARVYEQGNIVVIEDLQLDQRHLPQRGAARDAQAAASRRQGAHRRQRIHVRGRLMGP